MVIRISKNRIDMDGERLQSAELKNYSTTTVIANSGTAYSVDLTQGSVFYITLTGNCTFTFTGAPAAGKTGAFTLILKQDDTGSRTIKLPYSIRWPAGTTPTFSSLPYKVDIIRLITSDGGVSWSGKILSAFQVPLPAYLFTWGRNTTYGPLGLGDTVDRSSPVQLSGTKTWSAVAMGAACGLGIASDGSLWGWGVGGYLGTATVHRSSPIQLGSNTNWVKVVADYSHNGALTSDNKLFAWGYNDYGQVGCGDIVAHSSPVQIGGANWADVSVGMAHTLGITTDGRLFAWGRNNIGQLGTGDKILRSSPVQIGSNTNWAKAVAGRNHSLAITTSGTLFAWGNNANGQQGMGDRVSRSSPVQVGSGTTWAKVCAGTYNSVALTTDGKLWAWGYNYAGCLGLNSSTTDFLSPVQVGTGTNWANVDFHGYHALALTNDGKLWVWGSNANGRLGLGNVLLKYSSPTQLGTGTSWSIISAGWYGSAAA